MGRAETAGVLHMLGQCHGPFCHALRHDLEVQLCALCSQRIEYIRVDGLPYNSAEDGSEIGVGVGT